MQTLKQFFEEKAVRTVLDKNTQTRWFSAVDLCAAINNSDHNTARNYWKWLKRKWRVESGQLVSITNQLNFSSPNEKAYFTDALDLNGVLHLVMEFPNANAVPLRLWFAKRLAEDEQVLTQFEEMGQTSGGRPFKVAPLLQTTKATDLPLS